MWETTDGYVYSDQENKIIEPLKETHIAGSSIINTTFIITLVSE